MLNLYQRLFYNVYMCIMHSQEKLTLGSSETAHLLFIYCIELLGHLVARVMK